jgi:hypothetical protein
MTKPIPLIKGGAQFLYDAVTSVLHAQDWNKAQSARDLVHVGPFNRNSWLVALAPSFLDRFRDLPYRWIEEHWDLGEVERPRNEEVRSLLKQFQVSYDCCPTPARMREEFHRTAKRWGIHPHYSMWEESTDDG